VAALRSMAAGRVCPEYTVFAGMEAPVVVLVLRGQEKPFEINYSSNSV